jgi:hypothetical protein
MFICDNCLKENFENKKYLIAFASQGICDICGNLLLCNEVVSSFLVSKEDKENIDEKKSQ